jgi:NAD(P)-dependent dehydrogenase (short-subunit alcohol dehydrogenase family)
MKLEGKRIVVTGASSGIGLAFSRRLAYAGAKVVGVSRSPGDIEAALGHMGVKAVGCDVSDPAQIDAMIEKAKSLLGGIDIFVSNAGFAYYGMIGPPDWKKNESIFAVNVLAPIYILQKLAQDREEPLIYMVTISALGKMVLPGFSLYDATKFAMDGFVRTYRMENPKNIKIMPVYPVATLKTGFFKKAGGDDTPIPLPPQPVGLVAWCMELGLKAGARSVYTSLAFLIRCLLVRVLPVDLIVQGYEGLRFKAWRKRHGK